MTRINSQDMKVYLSRELDQHLQKLLYFRDRILLPRIMKKLPQVLKDSKDPLRWIIGETPEVIMDLYGEESSEKTIIRNGVFTGYSHLGFLTKLPCRFPIRLLKLKSIISDEVPALARGYHSIGKLHTHRAFNKESTYNVCHSPSLECFSEVDLGNVKRRLKDVVSKNPVDVVYCENPEHYSAANLKNEFLKVILF